MESLPRRIAAAVEGAAADTVPVEWGFGVGEERTVGHYRRAKLRSGRVRNTWLLVPEDEVVGPAGEIDPSLPVVAFRSAGRLQALLANFACHATCAGDGRWSANYPGAFARSLAALVEVAEDRVFYTSGAAANTNPAIPDAEEFGRRLAAAVPPILPTIEWTHQATITVRERPATVPPRQVDRFPYDLVAEAYAAKFTQLNFARVVKYYADEYAKLVERGPVPAETAIQVITLGEVAVVAIPGELFVELGREIRRRSPFLHTIVVTQANDWVGYVPHRAAFDEGGYEVIFASQSRLASEAGDLIVDAAVALLEDSRR